MGFSLSPAVIVKELDQTNVVPAVATSIGAIVADVNWGPCLDITTVASEKFLVEQFGVPDDENFKDWWSAANFLAYANDLRLIRPVNIASALNATAGVNGTTGDAQAGTGELLKNPLDYNSSGITAPIVARYPGALGNNLTVYVSDSTQWATNTFSMRENGTPATVSVKDYFPIPSADNTDELFIIVKYNDPVNNTDTVVETHIVSKTAGKKNENNEVYYADTYIAAKSKWIYFDYAAFISGTTDYDYIFTVTGSFEDVPSRTFPLAAGDNGSTALGDYQTAWDIFASAEDVDINLLMTGGGNETTMSNANVATLGKYVLQNVAEVRKDCVAFISPSDQSKVVSAANGDDLVTLKVTTDTMPSSSYGFYDGNYKYQYDKYNDTYRWLPMNGDMAGLCARTDFSNDPWWSPAGFNRGQIKGVTSLGFLPSKADRDNLYKNNINPITTFPGEGTVLFGDKTMQAKASAFQFINVRRLFIVLEKAISTASKYLLFEFNDATTRAVFINMVEPYLRRVQGRRGIQDFKVVADSTNNTPEVIDNAEFVGDIYIKPARSINVITLNFVATRTGVDFSEVTGG